MCDFSCTVLCQSLTHCPLCPLALRAATVLCVHVLLLKKIKIHKNFCFCLLVVIYIHFCQTLLNYLYFPLTYSPYWRGTNNYWPKHRHLKILLLNVMKRSVQIYKIITILSLEARPFWLAPRIETSGLN